MWLLKSRNRDGREGILAGGNWRGQNLIGVNINLCVAKICFEVITIKVTFCGNEFGSSWCGSFRYGSWGDV